MILSDRVLQTQLATLTPSPYSHTCIRRVLALHILTPGTLLLWTEGSKNQGARYTPLGSENTLYVAEDPFTALAETMAPLVLPMLPGSAYTPKPWVELPVHCVMSKVLDMTDASAQAKLESNYQELTGDWKVLQDQGLAAPTQRLGICAFQSGFQAIRFPSSKLKPHGVCLAVFVNLLVSGKDFVQVIDPSGSLVGRLP